MFSFAVLIVYNHVAGEHVTLIENALIPVIP